MRRGVVSGTVLLFLAVVSVRASVTYHAVNNARRTITFKFDFGYSHGGVYWFDVAPGDTVTKVNYDDAATHCDIGVYNHANGSLLCSLGRFYPDDTAVYAPGYLDYAAVNTGTYGITVKFYVGSTQIRSEWLEPGEEYSSWKEYCGTPSDHFEARWYDSSGSFKESATWNNGETAYPSWGGPPLTTADVTINVLDGLTRDLNWEIVEDGTVLASGILVAGQSASVTLDPEPSGNVEFWFVDPVTGFRFPGNLDTSTWTVDGVGPWNYHLVDQFHVRNDGLVARRFRYRTATGSEAETLEGITPWVSDWIEVVLETGDELTVAPVGIQPGWHWQTEVQEWIPGDEPDGGHWQSQVYEVLPDEIPADGEIPPSYPSVSDSTQSGSRWDTPGWVDDPPDSGVPPAPSGDSDAQHRELIDELEAIRRSQFETAQAGLEILSKAFEPGPVRGVTPEDVEGAFDQSESETDFTLSDGAGGGPLSAFIGTVPDIGKEAPVISIDASGLNPQLGTLTFDLGNPDFDPLVAKLRSFMLALLTVAFLYFSIRILGGFFN